MARGDGGKMIFQTDSDRDVFISRFTEVCERCGWKIHAWVLMGNHFHLLLETPEPNLVIGMKWLLGTFSQGWNRARNRRGHVFQGRYKAVPVNDDESDAYYFRIVADYIHLNPARAGLAGGTKGKLVDYKWSSLVSYAKNQQPNWLVTTAPPLPPQRVVGILATRSPHVSRHEKRFRYPQDRRPQSS